MNSKMEKISAFQLFSLLYLSRALTTVTYIPAYTSGLTPTDTIVQTLFRLIFGLVIMIPVYFVYKNNRSENIIDMARRRSSLLAKLLAAFYAAAFFFFTVETVARLDVFAGTIIFPETNVEYILIFVVLIGCYGAYLGLEALGRSSVLSLLLVVPALVFVSAMLVKRVDFLNFSPLFYNGITPTLKTAVTAVGRTVEYAMIVIALPRATGNVKKGFFIWLAAQILTTAAMFFLEAGVMGHFTLTQFFPMHTLSSLAEFSLFDRLDAIVTCVWILCAFIKIAFLIYLQVSVLRSEFGGKSPMCYLVPLGIALAAINLYVAGSIERFAAVDSSLAKVLVTVTAVFVIPLIIYFISGGKKCERQQLSSSQ